METAQIISSDLPPEKYRNQIIPAMRLERLEEPSAHAIKIKGYARDDLPCFYFHTWTLLEERFDCEDTAYLLATYSEWVIAWRLKTGKWIRQKKQIDRLKQMCRQPPATSEPEIIEEVDIAR